MIYIGMDIHKDFTVAVAKDKEGNVLKKGKFDNSQESFRRFLEDFSPQDTSIVMESSSVWEYIYETLDAMGYQVKLANPTKTKVIAESRNKTDEIDADMLCELLRMGSIYECYIPPKEIRSIRYLIRSRKSIVNEETRIINRIRAILVRNGLLLPFETICKKAFVWIKKELKNPIDISIIERYETILNVHEGEVKKFDAEIKKIVANNEDAKILISIYGFGPERSVEVLAEIGDINRFASANKLCSYAGLVPGIRQSGNTLRFGRLVKQASLNLKTSLIQASWILIRKPGKNKFREFYDMLAKKKGKQKAICAVARKLCCTIYAMLKKRTKFMLL